MITQHSLEFGCLHDADKNTFEVTAILTIKCKSQVTVVEERIGQLTVEGWTELLQRELQNELDSYLHYYAQRNASL